jgi:predicted Zn-dependent peptidase
LGLGYDFLERIVSEIEATTLDEFNDLIRSILNPDMAVEIVVGPENSEAETTRLP